MKQIVCKNCAYICACVLASAALFSRDEKAPRCGPAQQRRGVRNPGVGSGSQFRCRAGLGNRSAASLNRSRRQTCCSRGSDIRRPIDHRCGHQPGRTCSCAADGQAHAANGAGLALPSQPSGPPQGLDDGEPKPSGKRDNYRQGQSDRQPSFGDGCVCVR